MGTYSVVAVTLYLALLVIVGLRSRRHAADSKMFNVFGRRAGLLLATAGYLSLIGGGELLTLSQLGFDNGIGFLWFLSGLVLGFFFLAAFGNGIREQSARLGANTLTGFVRAKYGWFPALGFGLVYVVALGSLLTIQFIVGGDLLAAVTGIPRDVTPVVMAAVIMSYLMIGGYVSVLSTDVLRAVILTVVLVVFGYVMIVSFDASSLVTAPYAPLGAVDGWPLLVLGVFGVVCAADVWQTVIASADAKVLSRSMITAALVFLVVGTAIAFIGAFARTAVADLPPNTSALLAAATEAFSPQFEPLIALLVIGAVIATADTEIWVITTSIISVKNGAPLAGEDHEAFQQRMMVHARTLIPMITLLAMGLAYVTRNGQGLYNSLLVLLTAIAPAMVAILFAKTTKLMLALSVWGGVFGFLFVSVVYQLGVPVTQSLLPAAFSLGGLVIGFLLSLVWDGADFAKRSR